MSRRRTPKSAARRARVIELRRARWYWSDIGADLGITAQGAQQLYQAAGGAPVARLEEHRAEESDLTDRAVRELLALAGASEVSPRARIDAWAVIRSWSERRCKLLGLDAPAKVATVITEDMIDAEIARLQVEIEARTTGG
jgi:hypothetical protein